LIPAGFILANDVNPIEPKTLGELTDAIVGVIFYIAIVLCPAGIIAGGFVMLFAGANPSNIELGKKIILYSAVILGTIIIIKAMVSFFAPDLTVSKPAVVVSPGPISLPAPLFTPPAVDNDALQIININASLNNDGNLFTFQTSPIYAMSVKGRVTITTLSGFARIILTDAQDNKYLVYEAQGPFDQGTTNFDNICFETCVLNGIMPKSVDAEMEGATVKVDQLFILEDSESLKNDVQAQSIVNYKASLQKQQTSAIAQRMNTYNKQKGLRWTAGNTVVSEYTYAQKKMLLGMEEDEKLPNLQGFEYYKEGIYEISASQKSVRPSSAVSDLPGSFDWRNRHGKNWLTEVKNQGRCGSCWAFAIVGAIEATTNLYFNQKLNLNLSEQDPISCWSSGGCAGSSDLTSPIDHYTQGGVTTENCFPYRSGSFKYIPCEEKCTNWQNLIIKSAIQEKAIEIDESEVKLALIEKGPLAVGGLMWISGAQGQALTYGGHGMVLTGYDTYPDPGENRNIWIFKNSWGENWGEQGYLKIFSTEFDFLFNLPPIGQKAEPQIYPIGTPITISYMPDLKVNCVDEDGDGYCWWGIGPKPDSCPVHCKEEPDCDDSNPNLGEYDSNYNCLPAIIDNSPPVIGSFNYTSVGLTFNAWVSVSDDTDVSGCSLEIKEGSILPMSLSSIPCKSCGASVEAKFMDEGVYTIYVKCWDKAGNMQKGKEVEVEIKSGTAPPHTEEISVSTIQPLSAEVNETKTFYANVSSDNKIVSCILKINNSTVDYMHIDPPSCHDCKAWIDYSFNQTGNYNVLARCVDEKGNSAEGSPVTIEILTKTCPELTYPDNMWQRVWYDYQPIGKKPGSCLGQWRNEGFIKFDNNWKKGIVAMEKKDNIFLTSSRTINLPKSGIYTFTVGSDDGVRVWINDILYLDKWVNRSYKEDIFTANLTAGANKFRIDYYERTVDAKLSFSYQEPAAPITQYTLSVSRSGDGSGSVISIPSSIDCGSQCRASFDKSTSVTLMAAPDSQSNFTRWEGGCSGTASSCSVNMNSDKSVTAVFTKKSVPIVETWLPCNPTNGWICDKNKSGNASCEGKHIGWGRGDDGEVVCPEGTIVLEGLCQGANDDYVKTKEVRIKMVPSPQSFSASTTFKPRSSWYCNFGCSGFFCGADGCGWAKCVSGQTGVNKIELKIYNLAKNLVYNGTVTGQDSITWDGKNNQGEQLANGTYLYYTKTHLSDGRIFENKDNVYLMR